MQSFDVAVQIVGGALLALSGMNSFVLLRLSFAAGRFFEKMDHLENRVKKLESDQCPHAECPVKAQVQIGMVAEAEKAQRAVG